MLFADRRGGVVVYGGLVCGERGRGYFRVALSQNEQRDDPEHGEQHLLQMRILRDARRRYEEKMI